MNGISATALPTVQSHTHVFVIASNRKAFIDQQMLHLKGLVIVTHPQNFKGILELQNLLPFSPNA